MNTRIHKTDIPAKRSIQALLDSFILTASLHKGDLGLSSYTVRQVCESKRRELLKYEANSEWIKNFFTNLEIDLHRSLASAAGVDIESRFNVLVYMASLTYQVQLLTQMSNAGIAGPGEAETLVGVHVDELVATWRHGPWLPTRINLAQPEPDTSD